MSREEFIRDASMKILMKALETDWNWDGGLNDLAKDAADAAASIWRTANPL